MDTSDWYRRWAELEARGSSPTYERLALALASDDFALELLAGLEPVKRQPNLLFGAIRWHGGGVDDPDACLAWLRHHADEVLETMRVRRTQTNEVARCAVLLPALASLTPPLSLIEVGASAGLCLLYDRWNYRYRSVDIDHVVASPHSSVTLHCEAAGAVPVPAEVPEIAWRRGLDLHPVDPTDADEQRWLECLIWPEHNDRVDTLRRALPSQPWIRRPCNRATWSTTSVSSSTKPLPTPPLS